MILQGGLAWECNVIYYILAMYYLSQLYIMKIFLYYAEGIRINKRGFLGEFRITTMDFFTYSAIDSAMGYKGSKEGRMAA